VDRSLVVTACQWASGLLILSVVYALVLSTGAIVPGLIF
jgi:hypothetical protein